MAKTNFIVRGGMDLSKIQQGFKKTQSEIVKFKSTSKRELKTTQSTFDGFQKGISKAVKAIAVVLSSLAIGKFIKESTSLAIAYESSFNQVSRTLGANAREFNQWANSQAKAYGMAKSEAVKYGAVYSNLISGFTKDTEKTSRYTTELLKTSSVVASATGRTMEDTMERIRSGLLGNTESVEDLGIYVNIAMLESTEAFKKFAGSRSWKQLTFQEQQQIRLMSIMEQAAAKYGDELSNTTATGLMKFQATLKDIKLNLGRAFKPIVDYVIPALDKMAQSLERTTALMADFMEELFGKNKKSGVKVTEQQAAAYNGVASAITNAANAAKKAQTGFDELNIVQTNETDEEPTLMSNAGKTELGAGTEVSPDVKNAVSKFKGDMKKLGSTLKTIFIAYGKKIMPALNSWSKVFDGMKTPVQNGVKAIKESMKSLGESMGKYLGYYVFEWLPSLQNGFAETFAPIFADLMPVAFEQFKTDAMTALTIVETYIRTMLIPAAQFMQTVFTDVFKGIQISWDTYGAGIIEGFTEFKQSVKEIWTSIYEKIIEPVFSKIGTATKDLWNNHLKGLWNNLTDFLGSFTEMSLALWNNVLAPFIKWFINKFGEPIQQAIGTVVDIFKTAFGLLSDIVGGFIKSLSGFMKFLTGVFTGDWKKAWDGIKQYFQGVWDMLYGIFKGVINLIIDGVNLLWEGIYGSFRIIVDSIGGVAGALGDLFGKDWKFSMPDKAPLIPKLATGGIVEKSTLVNVGEAGSEAILPLERNLRWMDILAEKINSRSGGASQIINKIYMDGKLIKEEIVDLINEETILSGRSPILGV